MTVAVSSIRLPSTIAAIVLLSAICIIPVLLYLRIILKFVCDRNLQRELRGQQEDTDAKEGAPDENDTATETSSAWTPPKVLLSFRDVTYTVKPTRTKPAKQILKGVSGYFAPSTLTAILGTSGCGKTTLLTVLADQIDATGDTTGDVFVNGKKRESSFRRLCAYVMQSDNLLESLTVRESLWFTAELRLGKYSAAEKMAIVRKILLDLDLVAAADRRISVLSGGQKRRVTVAAELVAMPSLVFLDEPTSGLDASGSLKLVRVLRKLADSGRTIVCTIHQPRVDAFNLFHMVLLMNAGSLLYFGPMTRIVDYFTKVGQRHALENKNSHESVRNLLGNKQKLEDQDVDEEQINPADFVLDFTHGSSSEVQQYCDDFAGSVECRMVMAVVDLLHFQGETLKPDEYFGHESLKDDPAWFPELHHFPSPVVARTGSQEEQDDADGQGAACCQLIGRRRGPRQSRIACVQNTTNEACECCIRTPYQVVTKYASTQLKQTFTLTRRAFVSNTRNTAYIMSWVLGIIMMLFMGMLYCYVSTPTLSVDQLQVIDDNLQEWGACTQNLTALGIILGGMSVSQANQTLLQCGQELSQSAFLGLARTSLLYQLLASMFFSEMPLVASIYQERNLYLREHASRSYSSFAWTSSWICRIAFSGLVKGVVYPPFVYFSAQLPIAFEPYVLFCIFMGIMSVMGASMALLVTVAFESFETASVAFVVVNIISQNLCGYFISEQYIPWWFRWIYYVNFFRYTFQGTVMSQRLTPQSLQKAEDSDTVSTFQQLQETVWLFALVAIIFCIVIQLVALAIVQFSGSNASERCASCRCRGLRPVESGTTHTQFTPYHLGGAFALNTYVRKDVQTNPVLETAPTPSLKADSGDQK